MEIDKLGNINYEMFTHVSCRTWKTSQGQRQSRTLYKCANNSKTLQDIDSVTIQTTNRKWYGLSNATISM